VIERLGGPAALDAALFRLGDDTTEVTRTEPALNDTVPGDQRDTTTPRALTANLRAYVLGDILAGEERELLTTWLIDHSLGDTLVRAGTPKGWTVGDKSGAAAYGTRNDVAVIWPPSASPIVIAVMSSRTEADADYDDALVAAAARAAIASLEKRH
jgi:beta-lactamase class A